MAASKHPLMVDSKSWDQDAVMTHICDCLATSPKGLGSILASGYEDKNLPSYSTIMKWMEENEGLSDRYAKAKEAQADFMADEMLEIADDGRNDWMEQYDKDGELQGYRLNGEHVNRSRLRIDTRKWLASKLKAKRYGEKVQQEIAGKDGGPIETKDVSMEEVARKMAFILASGVAEKEKKDASDKEG